MSKNKVGRPTVMTEAVIGKLELLFAKGLTDREACLLADIDPSTLYDYCNKHPEFTERKEALKQHPTAKARLNVIEAIEKGDSDLSKWWLERKARDEFSTKQTIDGDIKITKLEDLL